MNSSSLLIGDGKYLTFSNQVRYLDKKVSFDLPSGVTKENMDATKTENIFYAKEKLNNGSELYAVNTNTYEVIKQAMSQWIAKGMLNKDMSFIDFLGMSKMVLPATTIPGSNYKITVYVYPHEFRKNYLVSGNEYIPGYLTSKVEMKNSAFIEESFSQMWFDTLLSVRLIIKNGKGTVFSFSTACLMLMTPDASIGANSPYTLSGTIYNK